MDRETGLGSRSERKAVADAIQRYLDAKGLARKDIIREHLSKSTIEKLFQGDFTDRTLNKVEGVLGTSFRQMPATTQSAKVHTSAAKSVGGYVFEAVEYLQGDYLCVRPMFANPTNLSAYLVSISWSDDQSCLLFDEKSRFDAKYSQRGTVYIPFGTSFMNLVSSNAGNLRMILLSLPDADNVLRGIVSTLSNPKGATFIPAAAPIFLRRLREGEVPELGVISGESNSYDEYQSLLSTVVSEGFGIFATPQPSTDRRKTMAVVKP